MKKRKKRLGKVEPQFLTTGAFLGRRRSTVRLGGQVRRTVAITIALLAWLLVLGAPAGLAKDKNHLAKAVTGQVFDEAENPVEGAAVELTDVQSGKTVAIYSQKDGEYHFSDLMPSHDYKVKATFKGASSEVRQISSLDMRTRPVLNLTIPGLKR
jgi:hypothetical protein